MGELGSVSLKDVGFLWRIIKLKKKNDCGEDCITLCIYESP